MTSSEGDSRFWDRIDDGVEVVVGDCVDETRLRLPVPNKSLRCLCDVRPFPTSKLFGETREVALITLIPLPPEPFPPPPPLPLLPFPVLLELLILLLVVPLLLLLLLPLSVLLLLLLVLLCVITFSSDSVSRGEE